MKSIKIKVKKGHVFKKSPDRAIIQDLQDKNILSTHEETPDIASGEYHSDTGIIEIVVADDKFALCVAEINKIKDERWHKFSRI